MQHINLYRVLNIFSYLFLFLSKILKDIHNDAEYEEDQEQTRSRERHS